MAFYISLLLTRGPSFRDGIQEYHKHAAEIILQKEYEYGRLPEPPEILKERIVNNDITSVIDTVISPHVSLQHMLDIASNIGQSLCNKKWDIYYIQKNEFFVTSDTPVIFESIDPKTNRTIGPAHPESLVLCPITKKTLISVRPFCKDDNAGFEFMLVKDRMVDALNEMMCFNAQRFVYAPEQSPKLLKYIKNAEGSRKKLNFYRFGDTILSRWDIEFTS